MTPAAARLVEGCQGHVQYFGRPGWLDDEILKGLVSEADESRPSALENRRGQFGARAGKLAAQFAGSGPVTAFLERFAKSGMTCGESTFLYYESVGSGIVPHIDRPEFEYQILLMLRHTGYGARRSSLAVFPDGPKSGRFFPMEPGELVLFQAASVIHGRTDTTDGEVVNLLGLGFA